MVLVLPACQDITGLWFISGKKVAGLSWTAGIITGAGYLKLSAKC